MLGDLETNWQLPRELPELHGPQVWDLETRDPYLKKLGPGWAFKNRAEYGHTVGFAVSADNIPEGIYVPIRHEGGDNLPEDTVIRWARSQVKKPSPKIFANASYDIGWMQEDGIEINPLEVEDIQLQAPLLNEYRLGYSLDALSFDLLGARKNEDLLNRALIAYGYGKGAKGDKGGIHKLPGRLVGPYGCDDARLTRGVWLKQKVEIEKEDLQQIYNLERHLVHVVVAMRRLGVRVDLDRIQQLRERWAKEMYDCQVTVGRHTDVSITAWDTLAIESALNKLNITVLPTEDGKPSITADWLQELIKQSTDTATRETLASIRRLRLLDKASNTFLVNYFLNHCVDGRVHVQFNQLRSDEGGTVSGRFSSSDFNMQNLPARDEEIGPAVRSCAIPEEGKKWLAADYSSQEPRLTVHWACRAGMVSAFAARQKYRDDPETDYHQMVADICGIKRGQAKPINLGLAYGMGGPKLCRSLGLPTAKKVIMSKKLNREIEIDVPGPEGQAILNKYHAGVPFVSKLFKMAEDRGRSQGFIRTLLGRKCRTNANAWKNADPRKAMNKLIQGSAADQTKETMRQLYYDHGITPMATVHDELDFSVATETEAWHVVGLMEKAVELEVPTIVDCKLGDNWGFVEKLKRAA